MLETSHNRKVYHTQHTVALKP